MTRSSPTRLVRIAATLLVVYGAAVVVNATVWQVFTGWQDAPEYGRALVRFLGMGCIAWGLVQRRRWAWWFAVVLPSFWLLAGVGALTLYFLPGVDSSGVTAAMAAYLLASLAALVAAVAILVRRDVRHYFKPQPVEQERMPIAGV